MEGVHIVMILFSGRTEYSDRKVIILPHYTIPCLPLSSTVVVCYGRVHCRIQSWIPGSVLFWVTGCIGAFDDTGVLNHRGYSWVPVSSAAVRTNFVLPRGRIVRCAHLSCWDVVGSWTHVYAVGCSGAGSVPGSVWTRQPIGMCWRACMRV
jgi:hypothetical protein